MILAENESYRSTSLQNAIARGAFEEAERDERIGLELIGYRAAILTIASVERRRGTHFEWRRDPDGSPVYTQTYEMAPWSEEWEQVSAIVSAAAEREVGRAAAVTAWDFVGEVVSGIQTDIVGDGPWAAYAIIARRLITPAQHELMIAPMRKLGVDFVRIESAAAMLRLEVTGGTSAFPGESTTAERKRWWQRHGN